MNFNANWQTFGLMSYASVCLSVTHVLWPNGTSYQISNSS